MEINELAATGYAVATVTFTTLSVLLITRWNDRPKAGLVALGAASTAVWAFLQTIGSLGHLNEPAVLLIAEWIRNISWLTALASILRDLDPGRRIEQAAIRYGAIFLIAAGLLIAYYWVRTTDSLSMIGIVAGGLVLSTLNLVFVEQVYRSAPFDARSSLKYLCVGIAGISIYDFVIFGWTIISSEMNVDHWAARGFVYAIFALPIGFAARRPFRMSLDVHMPRQIVFYSFGIIAAGTFIIFLLLGDYYVRTLGGTWGGALRIVFFGMSSMALTVLLVSSTVRARVRVFLTKSFFQYKYDYRKEWLRFIGTLSGTELDNVANAAVRAVAQIVNSPGGVVWVQEEQGGNYTPLGRWGDDIPELSTVNQGSSLVRFLRKRQWVIDLYELKEHPARYDGLQLEPGLVEDRCWLIIPMLLGERLLGFIMLLEPRIVKPLNFEDHDLLRTVGRHAATHIDQAESDKRLAEASQFGAYNRLTAFLMHDLNNLIAQQSLVVKNAEKFRHNPEFVDDAIDTIANSVKRMRRLMAQLSDTSAQAARRRVGLRDVVERAAKRVSFGRPIPTIRIDTDGLLVEADPERLTTVIEHLLRNAQDATDENGQIEVECDVNDTIAILRIRDSGCGMTSEFVRERLFRPFDSTKGSESMGIGAYQAREYVRQLGGQLEVTSSPGKGTTFSIQLPLVS